MQNLLKKVWSNEFSKGAVYIFISSYISNFLNYVFNILLGRSLGPTGYGEINALYSYISLISFPMGVLATIVIQKIGQAESQIKTVYLLEEFFLRKLKTWIPLLLILLILTPFLSRITNLSMAASLSMIPLIYLSVLGSFYGSVLHGLRAFVLIASITIIAGILKTLGPVLTSLGVDGMTTILIFLFLSQGVGIPFAFYYIRRKIQASRIHKTEPKIDRRLITVFTSKAFLLTASSTIAVTIFGTFDIIIVKKFLSGELAGIYSSWSLFAKIIFYILGPIQSVIFVFFATKTQSVWQSRILIMTLITLLLVSMLSYIGYSFLPSFIVHFFFGSKFDAVIPLLQYASIFGFFYSVVAIINSYFLAKRSKFTLILTFSIIIYIILLLFIPKQLINIIWLNIVFSFAVSVIYIFAFWKFRNK